MIPFKINISDALRTKCPNLRLGCVLADVKIQSENEQLWERINGKTAELAQAIPLEEISQLPNIYHTREAYKALGKKPGRYRSSAEAMLRRIVPGKGLYKINNAVDLLNLVSITTQYSIGGYDANKIQGDILFDIGQEGEPYNAIGRGDLNIANLPTFRDEHSAFGSPTSDSVRTSVTDQTPKFLMLIIDFGQTDQIETALQLSEELLKKFGHSEEVLQSIVSGQ